MFGVRYSDQRQHKCPFNIPNIILCPSFDGYIFFLVVEHDEKDYGDDALFTADDLEVFICLSSF